MISLVQESAMTRYLIAMILLFAPGIMAGQGRDGYLRKVVQDAANAQLPKGAVAVKLVKLRLPASVPMSKQAGVGFRRGEDFSGSTLVRLDAGKRSVWVQAEFKLLVNTVVARNNLQKGQVLSAQDLKIKAIAKRLLRGQDVVKPRDVLGMIVERQIREGEPILKGALKRPVIVRRGDEVQIVVSSGKVQVSSSGKALASGRAGDVINVSRDSAKSRGYRLRARVVASGLVMLELENPASRGL